VLAKYQRWRRLDTSAMAMVTDGMNRLFSNDIAPIRAARDFGLGVVDRLPVVKAAMIRQAAAIKRRRAEAAARAADLRVACQMRCRFRRNTRVAKVEGKHRTVAADERRLVPSGLVLHTINGV